MSAHMPGVDHRAAAETATATPVKGHPLTGTPRLVAGVVHAVLHLADELAALRRALTDPDTDRPA